MDNKIAWQTEHYPSLPSTNDYCIEQAKLKLKNNLVVLADAQSKPRGSRGRQWIEPKGNLALSFLYWPSFSASQMIWVSFVTAIALYDAVVDLCGHHDEICIKWPNDLLFRNKKLGGILIESHITPPDQLKWFVAGIGVNIRSKPVLFDRQVACLYDFVKECPTPYVLSVRIRRYFSYWLDYIDNHKEKEIREAWLKRSIKINTPMVVTIQEQHWEGLYKGIDDFGFLLLKIKNKIERFSTGEVFCSDKGEKK